MITIPVQIIVGEKWKSHTEIKFEYNVSPSEQSNEATVTLSPGDRLSNMMMSGDFTMPEFLRALADDIEETG